MNYTVAYDLLGQSYDFKAVGLGLLLIAFGAYNYFSNRNPEKTPNLINKILHFIGISKSTILAIVVGLFVTVESVYHLFYVQYGLRKAYADGDYKVIEGPITNFKPMPYHGHAKESFEVEGVKFAYTDYFVSSGFCHPSAYGGPIREGLLVRIRHIGPYIIKLEIIK